MRYDIKSFGEVQDGYINLTLVEGRYEVIGGCEELCLARVASAKTVV
jgi:hypothetical protein